MKQNPSPYTDTFNKIWQTLQETGQKLEKMREESDREREEREKSNKAFDKRMKVLDRQIQKVCGRFNERWGRFVESLVEGKLSRLLRAKGIQVIHTYSRIKRETIDKKGEIIDRKEFDIIAVNGKEVVVVEVKTVLTPKKVDIFLEKYLKDFKKYFPDHKKRTLYGAVAFLTNEDEADAFAEEKGLFVIKATGDSAHIINKTNFKPKVFP